MVTEKITERTPDEVCLKCSQCWEGECRAYEMPHSKEEYAHRSEGYGMECDSQSMKELRKRRYDAKYRT